MHRHHPTPAGSVVIEPGDEGRDILTEDEYTTERDTRYGKKHDEDVR